jgi:hypothetical protein
MIHNKDHHDKTDRLRTFSSSKLIEILKYGKSLGFPEDHTIATVAFVLLDVLISGIEATGVGPPLKPYLKKFINRLDALGECEEVTKH